MEQERSPKRKLRCILGIHTWTWDTTTDYPAPSDCTHCGQRYYPDWVYELAPDIPKITRHNPRYKETLEDKSPEVTKTLPQLGFTSNLYSQLHRTPPWHETDWFDTMSPDCPEPAEPDYQI